MLDSALQFLLILAFVIVGLLLVRFFLGNTKKTMNTSVEMQEKALSGQDDAIEMCRETLELNKKMLSELRAIKELLEKR